MDRGSADGGSVEICMRHGIGNRVTAILTVAVMAQGNYRRGQGDRGMNLLL